MHTLRTHNPHTQAHSHAIVEWLQVMDAHLLHSAVHSAYCPAHKSARAWQENYDVVNAVKQHLTGRLRVVVADREISERKATANHTILQNSYVAASSKLQWHQSFTFCNLPQQRTGIFTAAIVRLKG